MLIKKVKQTKSSSSKWENQLDTVITSNDWYSICKRPFKVTTDTKLQWFQYRINNNIIATNTFLYKINIRSDELCSFCQKQVETIRHLFCQCNYVKPFWKQLEYLFQKNNVTFYGNQGLSDRIILFGVDGDKVVNVILLLAKFHIYRSRVQNSEPNYVSFLAEIKKYIRIVKYIAISNRNIKKFDQMWGLWKL